MQRVSDHMPQSWMGIPIEADRVRDLSFFMLHESVDAGDLPMPWSGPSAIDMWLDAAEGDASGMALTSLLSRLLMPKFMHWGHTLAMGSSTMDYVDPRRDYDRELALDHPIIGAPMSQIYRSVSWGWPANPDRVEYNEPQPSDIETLLINGTLDFTTPFEQPTRDKLLSQLSHGRFVQLRDLGHTATFWHSQDQARARLLNTFLDEGRVDDSLYVYQAPVFKVRGLDGFFDRLLLILAAACIAVTGLLWLVIRAVRQRWRARRLQPVV
jgi:pimeloyl-ACP methyl ester carboxylesterase